MTKSARIGATIALWAFLLLSAGGANAGSLRQATRQVRPLSGTLDSTPVFNSNNPEVIGGDGILLSTFSHELGPANLDFAFSGRFDVFAHHVVASTTGKKRDLYLGLLIGNSGEKPVVVDVINAASYLTRPDAPFIPLPSLTKNDGGDIYSGPGDRVTSDLLRNTISKSLKSSVTVRPGKPVLLQRLAIPVPKVTSQLNGRTYLAQLQSDGPIRLALVARFVHPRRRLARFLSLLSVIPPIPIHRFLIPREGDFLHVLNQGRLVEPRERPPSQPEAAGRLRYGRVSGVTIGSCWQTVLTDKGLEYLALPKPDTPISYVLSSLAGGTFGTDQVQSAPLAVRYDDTAFEGHGNYGVKYDLTLPLKNVSARPLTLRLSLETPVKSNSKSDSVGFLRPPSQRLSFRGTIKVTTQSKDGRDKVEYLHVAQHYGEPGEPFYILPIALGQAQAIRVELFYPPDCTPPQLLTISTVP